MGPYYIMGNESINYEQYVKAQKSKKQQSLVQKSQTPKPQKPKPQKPKPQTPERTEPKLTDEEKHERKKAYLREYQQIRYRNGEVKPKTEEQKEQKKKSMRAWYAKNSEKVNAKRSLKRAQKPAEISGSTSLPVPPPSTHESRTVLPPSIHESLPVSPPSAYQPLPVPQPNYYPPFGPPNYPPPPIPTDEEIAEADLTDMQEDQKAASILDEMLNGPKAKTNDEYYDDIDAVELLTKIRNKNGGKKRKSSKNKSKKNRKSKKNKK